MSNPSSCMVLQYTFLCSKHQCFSLFGFTKHVRGAEELVLIWADGDRVISVLTLQEAWGYVLTVSGS